MKLKMMCCAVLLAMVCSVLAEQKQTRASTISQELGSRDILLFQATLEEIGLDSVYNGEEEAVKAEDMLKILWRNKQLDVYVVGREMVPDVVVTDVTIYWSFVGEGDEPILRGLVTTSGDKELFAVKVATPSKYVHFVTAGVAVDANSEQMLQLQFTATSCKCVGTGGTGTCGDEDCDTAESCGGNAHCKWMAVKDELKPRSAQ